MKMRNSRREFFDARLKVLRTKLRGIDSTGLFRQVRAAKRFFLNLKVKFLFPLISFFSKNFSPKFFIKIRVNLELIECASWNLIELKLNRDLGSINFMAL